MFKRERRMTDAEWDRLLEDADAPHTLEEYRASKLSSIHFFLERVAVALGVHPTEKGIGNVEQILHLLDATNGIERAVGRRVIEQVNRAEAAQGRPSLDRAPSRIRALREGT